MGSRENAYVVQASTMAKTATDYVRQIPIVCPGHSRAIVELHYSPPTDEGVFLLSACLDKQPMLRSGDTGDWIGTFEGHKGAVWAASMDPSAHRVVTASADMSAKAWDALTGDELWNFDHPSVVKQARISTDAKRMLTGGFDKLLRIFDLEKPEAVPQELRGCTKRIKHAFFYGPGDHLVLSGEDETTELKVWDSRSGEVVRALTTEVGGGKSSGGITDVEISAGGKYITIAVGDAVQIWDAGSFSLVNHYNVGDFGLQAASLHPDSDPASSTGRFITGGQDMAVRVFDLAQDAGGASRLLEEHRGHHGPVMSARYAPGGATYATGADDATIRIWQTAPKAEGTVA